MATEWSPSAHLGLAKFNPVQGPNHHQQSVGISRSNYPIIMTMFFDFNDDATPVGTTYTVDPSSLFTACKAGLLLGRNPSAAGPWFPSAALQFQSSATGYRNFSAACRSCLNFRDLLKSKICRLP